MVNKKTGKTAAVEMVLFDMFNKDGKIAVKIRMLRSCAADDGDEITVYRIAKFSFVIR